MSTNPKIMDLLGSRPASQGGPAATGGQPPSLHRGQSHHQGQGADSRGVRAPFHPGNREAFREREREARRSRASS